MIARPREAGIAPILAWGAVAAYSKIAFIVANVGLTAWAVVDVFGGDDPGEELAETQTTAKLDACKADLDQGAGLTQGAKSYYLDELDGWRAAASSQLAGNQIAIATAHKTIDNLAGLYQSDTDQDGNPIGLCHVYAGTQIIERQLAKLKTTPAGEIPAISSQGTAPSLARADLRWGVIAWLAAGAIGLFALWRMKK